MKLDLDLMYLSFGHWGMFPVWWYPFVEPAAYSGWPMMYCGDSYDAKYLHG